MKAMAAISRIGDCQDEAEALSLLQIARADLGCDSSVFVSFLNYEDHETCRFMLDASSSWCNIYRKNSMCNVDPWIRHASESTEPATCEQIAADFPGEHPTFDLARQHGAQSSYVIPAPSKIGASRFGVLILCSRTPGHFSREQVARVKPLARALSMELNAWWVSHARQELINKLRISDLDLKLLRLERDGYKTKDIVKMLEMSASAIDTAFHRLANKLDTSTRSRSVIKASAYGLI